MVHESYLLRGRNRLEVPEDVIDLQKSVCINTFDWSTDDEQPIENTVSYVRSSKDSQSETSLH